MSNKTRSLSGHFLTNFTLDNSKLLLTRANLVLPLSIVDRTCLNLNEIKWNVPSCFCFKILGPVVQSPISTYPWLRPWTSHDRAQCFVLCLSLKNVSTSRLIVFNARSRPKNKRGREKCAIEPSEKHNLHTKILKILYGKAEKIFLVYRLAKKKNFTENTLPQPPPPSSPLPLPPSPHAIKWTVHK